jgi:hypothetical protein
MFNDKKTDEIYQQQREVARKKLSISFNLLNKDVSASSNYHNYSSGFKLRNSIPSTRIGSRP